MGAYLRMQKHSTLQLHISVGMTLIRFIHCLRDFPFNTQSGFFIAWHHGLKLVDKYSFSSEERIQGGSNISVLLPHSIIKSAESRGGTRGKNVFAHNLLPFLFFLPPIQCLHQVPETCTLLIFLFYRENTAITSCWTDCRNWREMCLLWWLERYCHLGLTISYAAGAKSRRNQKQTNRRSSSLYY